MKCMSLDSSRQAESIDTHIDVFQLKGVAVIDEKLKMLPGYCSQAETLSNNWSRMRDRGSYFNENVRLDKRNPTVYKKIDYFKST